MKFQLPTPKRFSTVVKNIFVFFLGGGASRLPPPCQIPGESKKYTRLTSHNTASIASILKIRLGLDR